MERIILHCDLNSFFASVELLSRPELRDVPVAVSGDPASRHGIILAKNEPAKKFGVKTAETIWQAKKKCPDLVLLPSHHALYREYSKKVNAIYDEYTDLVEPFGIDESWLDVTHTLHLFGGDAKGLADALRARLREELGLTISVGVSFNKVFTKLGSDYKKPDATTVISPENWKEIVWPLPVGDLLFVGAAARKAFAQYGVETVGQLAACKREMTETL
ncbi:MAG: DNA polymerase IV, partial [Oscillibacter sp.]|nr:DNA polymerase IV [Oscillibacter sp.]